MRDVVEYVAVEFILFFAVIKSLMLRDVVQHNGVNFSPSFLWYVPLRTYLVEDPVVKLQNVIPGSTKPKLLCIVQQLCFLQHLHVEFLLIFSLKLRDVVEHYRVKCLPFFPLIYVPIWPYVVENPVSKCSERHAWLNSAHASHCRAALWFLQFLVGHCSIFFAYSVH